jgi:uncharacterized membrane protein
MAGQRKTRRSSIIILAVLVVAIAASGVRVAHASSANLSVASSGTVLVAARNNTLTINITNVGKYLKDFDITLTIPPPLVLFGDNHWIRPSFSPGESINANLTVFAPSSAAGTTQQGSVVALYKAIGEATLTTENHAISFLVRGWIDIAVYEITVDPELVLPGQEVTISGNILNRGVVSAMYTNVTVDSDETFVQGSVQPTYVGEVDPNAPAPFSVTATVDSSAREGTHEATVSVYYTDDLQFNHVIKIPITFTVVLELPTTATTRTDIVSQLLSVPFIALGIGVIIVLVVVAIYLHRRRRSEDSA